METTKMTTKTAEAVAAWMRGVFPLGPRWDTSIDQWRDLFNAALKSLPTEEEMRKAIAPIAREWRAMDRDARKVPAPEAARGAQRALLAWTGEVALYGRRWLDAIKADDAATLAQLTLALEDDHAKQRMLQIAALGELTTLAAQLPQNPPPTLAA